MKLTLQQVKQVVKLANLSLKPKEEKKYSEQLSKILKFVKLLNQVDTSNIAPTFNVSGQRSADREKKTTSVCLTQKEALLNVSKEKDGFFVTDKVAP